ncbi:MAG: DNA-binding transcriptional regulator LsrR (DeoR family), partial [Alteromonas macleodii]
QKGVREMLEMAQSATLKIVGIGTVGEDTQLVQSGMIEPKEIQQVIREGGIGELLGHFFDIKGNHLETTLTSRTIATQLSDTPDTQVVALAGGTEKIAPLHAVLQSGRLSGLLTDERTARLLLNEPAQT